MGLHELGWKTGWALCVLWLWVAPALAQSPSVAQPPMDEIYATDAPPVMASGERAPSLPAAVPAPAPEQVAAEGPSRAEQLAAMGYRSEIERTWFEAGSVNSVRGQQTRRRALELGAENLNGVARALIADESQNQALSNRLLAVRLAPDLPLAHMALAQEQWRSGDYREALERVARSVMAIPRNLDATVWLVGSLLLMFGTVLVASSLVFMLAIGASVFSHAAHDLGDLISTRTPAFSRAALICAVVLLPLTLGEGPLGLVLVVFAIGFIYGGPRHRMVLVLAAVLLVMGLYPMMRVAGTVLTALDADPIAAAALSVARGTETSSQVELLLEAERHDDDLAERALAVRARRVGDVAEAEERMQRLLASAPDDAQALTTLGNIAFHAGRTEDAIAFYEKAQASEPSAILMFNLSQAYAKTFRMQELEHALAMGQELGPAIVGELSRMGDTEFVADPPFPMASIRGRMLQAAAAGGFSAPLIRVLAPGRLGESWLHLAGGFFFFALVGALLSGRYQHASRCARCGRRICARCDDSMWSSDLCDGCHHLFNRPQGTDPIMRMARLQELRERESRQEKIKTIAAVVVPGAAGLLAKRPDLAFMGLILFAWAAVLLVWRGGVVPDPLAMGGAGSIAFVLAGVVMAFLYLVVLVSGLVIRRNL